MLGREDSSTKYLFGGPIPWNPYDWTSSNDTVRGGSSTSHLEPCASAPNGATFHGHLDTSTLGGAGFASQRSTNNAFTSLDLSSYSGIALTLDLGRSDRKRYVLTLKDEIPGRRPDGREEAVVSWEAEFTPPEGRMQGVVCLPWAQFKPFYRGREVKDAQPLKTEGIRRLGLMMRSFFDEQSGDFELCLRSIAAVGKESKVAVEVVKDDLSMPYRDEPEIRRSMDGVDEKVASQPAEELRWLGWLRDCFKL